MRAQTFLSRQINREDRLVVQVGVCWAVVLLCVVSVRAHTNTTINKHQPATTYSCTRLALDWEIPVGAGWCVLVCARAKQTPTPTTYFWIKIPYFLLYTINQLINYKNCNFEGRD